MRRRRRSLSEPTYRISAQDGPQSFFVACPVKDVVYGGARGGGKSYGLLLCFLAQAQQYGKHAVGLLLRRHYPDLEDLIEKSKEIFGPLGWSFHETKHNWRSPRGAILRMRPVERDADAEKHKGFSNTFLGIDEIGDFPDPRPLDKLWGTLRSVHGVPCIRRCTANPGGSGHGWVYSRYIKARTPYQIFEHKPIEDRPDLVIQTVFIPSRLEDNPALLKNDPAYEANLAASGDSKLFQAWRHGDWSILAGQYFDCFDPRVGGLHVRDARAVDIKPHYQRWISLDWGLGDPTVVHWHAMDEHSNVTTYREYCSSGKTSLEIGKEIVQRTGDEKITAFYCPSDITEQRGATHTIADEIASVTRPAGIPYPAPVKRGPDSRKGGWALMYQMLKAGYWHISDACPQLIEHLPLLIRDPENPEDILDSPYDHAPDSARYGLKAHIGSVRIDPAKIIIEKIEKIEDFTQRHIQYLREKDKLGKSSLVIPRRSRYGRPRAQR